MFIEINQGIVGFLRVDSEMRMAHPSEQPNEALKLRKRWKNGSAGSNPRQILEL